MAEEDRSVFELPFEKPDLSIAYGKSEDQVVDFYNSQKPSESIIVLIHGGYWRPEYDRKHLAPFAKAIADSGWSVALIEYRRIIGNPDAAMSDVINAIGEVAKQNSNLILIGHSAGGHLALLAANKTEVKGVIALAPVTDLVSAEALDLDEGAVSDFLGAPAKLRSDLDPIRQPALKVPTFLIHGELDIRVPPVFSRDYAPGSSLELLELEDVGHFELIDPRHEIFSVILEKLHLIGIR
ncbi:MAG: alpha/beta fold hydrolase [Actinobacteria bacterium]|uniref:Unannotated protein n=1 Tax=freshwater metagenome TaxID=449393 RepID=A0A6J6SLX0_9ZZZZ|nr:alpha/beta fold hydrolase [Actinomycetota bacterium]MSZ02418.1 alpha/beta fold hydrolase [Actinomycetota bacterium]